MSANKTLGDDAFVAKLLAEDAKKSSLRYAQQGLSALLPRRPTGAAPKPNTRFLKAIVREADSHNAALKKKEGLDARIRQRELGERNRRDFAEDDHKYEDARPRKRRRYSDEKSHRERRIPRQDISRGRLNTSSERSPSRERRGRRNGPVQDDERLENQLNGRHRQDRKRYRSRSRSEPWSADRQDRNRTAQRGRGNEKDYKRRHRSRSSQSNHTRDQQTSKDANRDSAEIRRSAVAEHDHSESGRHSTHDAYESDPLEVFVGPLNKPKQKVLKTEKPPVRSKGRGAYKPSSAVMDAHFSSDYNPVLDVHLESELEDEKEDWDMALEAIRDREMFKQKHAERLREAGFDDAEIKKWGHSGKEKEVEDVKWTARGEAREWDLGKVNQDNASGRPGGSSRSGMSPSWSKKNGGFFTSFKDALE